MSTSIPSFNQYRVAAIQYEPTLGEKEKNVTALLRLVEEAAQHDARLIVLPEMATTGYCWESRSEVAPYVEPIPGPTTERFQQVAARYGSIIALGLPEVDPATDVYYNSLALLGPEGVIGTYRKIHSYIAEPRWARDGDLGMPVWGPPDEEPWGDRLVDRRPSAYVMLAHNTYLWEPLRYHSLYELGELLPGQLSCVAIIQTNLQEWGAQALQNSSVNATQTVRSIVQTLITDHDPARPDVLVLPELLLPGPVSPSVYENDSAIIAHFQNGAIEVPGAETDSLVELAKELQISLVLGVAERVKEPIPTYYNTILLIDPEGVYGTYRKLHLTAKDRLWASAGNLDLPTFDTPSGRIGLATGYDVLFPETLRVLASK